jgi:hypothetical protein
MRGDVSGTGRFLVGSGRRLLKSYGVGVGKREKLRCGDEGA